MPIPRGELRHGLRGLADALQQVATVESGSGLATERLVQARTAVRQQYHDLLCRIQEIIRTTQDEPLNPKTIIAQHRLELMFSILKQQWETCMEDQPLCPGLLLQYRSAILQLPCMQTERSPATVNRIAKYFSGQ